MNRNSTVAFHLLTAILLAFSLTAPAYAQPAKAPSGAHDFVFLAEARPLLIRVHVFVDGKSLPAAWDDFIGHLFQHLDVKKQGYLGKEEIERAPPISNIVSGGFGGMFGGFGGASASQTGRTLKDIDTDKDGKVSRAELAAFYITQGLAPFQIQPEQAANQYGMMLGMGGMQPDPTVDAIGDAVFSLLDAKKSGKLSKAELLAAREILLRYDENEDELLTAREVPAKAGPIDLVYSSVAKSAEKDDAMMKMPGSSSLSGSSANQHQLVLLIPPSGEAPANFANLLTKRYFAPAKSNWADYFSFSGKGSAKSDGKKPPAGLSAKNLGLDDATFKSLDANRDGFLDAKELAGFVKRSPDLEFTLRLSSSGPGGVELKRRDGLIAAKTRTFGGLALLDLPATRVELRGEDEPRADKYGAIVRLQFSAIFKQADMNNDGYLDDEDMKAGNPFSQIFGGSLKAMDRDGDGRVSEREFDDYLAFLGDLRTRSEKACVSLVLSDESRGLFDLLDADRDGRLSVRELRGAAGLLEKLDLTAKGHLTRGDLPRSYRLTVRRGSVGGGDNYSAILTRVYGGSSDPEVRTIPTAGPAWFRKMDRNRDGDVSAREWLGTSETFNQIDADNDGLLSSSEADRFDARHRNPLVPTGAKVKLGGDSLFNGSDLAGWRFRGGDKASAKSKWGVVDSVTLDAKTPARLAGKSGMGVLFSGDDGRGVDLLSESYYGDCELHVEFNVAKGSNSGIYFQGQYEVQILDSFGKADADLKYGDCGGIYSTAPPKVNASKAPGEWQTFDITFQAPRFDKKGNKSANARFLKVVHNGVVIHENVEVKGPTTSAIGGPERPIGPLMLQGDHGPVAFRNLRLRPISGK